MNPILNDHYFVGREPEIQKLLKLLKTGLSFVIIGERGVGKSALLLRSYMELVNNNNETRRFVYIDDFTGKCDDLRKILFQISAKYNDLEVYKENKLISNWDDQANIITRAKQEQLKDMILNTLKKTKDSYVFLIDPIDRLTATLHPTISAIYRHATVIASSRSIYASKWSQLLFEDFEKVKISRLLKEEMEKLFDYLQNKYNLISENSKTLKKDFIKCSNGNPHVLKTMMHKGSLDKKVTIKKAGIIASSTLDPERLPLWPTLIPIVAVAMAYRYIARGMQNIDDIVLGGVYMACSMVVYMTIRALK
ncbi:MAG: ATP-binding protein [Pseudomonadota bacterium]